MTITQVSYEYKMESCGDKLWKVVAVPEKREVHSFADIGNRNKVPEYIRTELVENYADQLDPTLLALLMSKSSYAANYYNKLGVAKTFFEQSPAMAEVVMNAIRGDQYHGKEITYELFESLYPEYMLPLTPRLVRDYNPLDGIRYSYSKKEFKAEHEYKNYEALAYVINLYKSELISFNQMYDLLMSPEALNNPLFVVAFKKNFMQMNSFVNELVHENLNPEYTNMDLKSHYWNKTKEFFKEYGYTDKQIAEAFNGEGSTLKQFIAMGATRRSRK
jgi:predicted HTH domain antitoxin